MVAQGKQDAGREPYDLYWGKARPAEEGDAPLHLLACHSLDVAAVASVWWDASGAIRRAFAHATGLAEEHARAWVLFFVALHDLGKLDLRFQGKAPAALARLHGPLQHGLSAFQCRQYDHGQGGLYWFEQDRAVDAAPSGIMQVFAALDAGPAVGGHVLGWLRAVCGHHGHVRQQASRTLGDGVSAMPQPLRERDRAARLAWVAECEALFLAPLGLHWKGAPALAEDFLPFLAGFCSVCDWLGSRSEDGLFVYVDSPVALARYFADKVAGDARRVFADSGIGGAVLPFGGITALLRSGCQPHQLQTLIEATPIAAGLSLIEGPTGSGKTETALAMAWRLVSAGLADSIVFALPTQATSNAMFERVLRLAGVLFSGGPNILLAHGKAAFNEAFAQLKARAGTVQGSEEAWSQCAQWLAGSRKRVFLGQLGIGTVDQVLMAVLPVRHNFVRSFGMGRSVLIVDEVHAYDDYMNVLLAQVLRQQRAAGGSAILLSATLPSRQRLQLAQAWGCDAQSSTDYPLLTWCPSDGGNVQACTSRTSSPTPERSVTAECLERADMLPDDALLARIVAAAERGAQVGIICNLVDHAQQIHQRLKGMTQAPVILFHSRYTFADRQRIETSLDGLFGPSGDRSVGRILVATQVLEQSIDVDMDWLVTQLCPVELLFQRMGRMHRHARPWRPEGFTDPTCTVLVPAEDDFGGHGAVYRNGAALWRTWQLLVAQRMRPIRFPTAYREWIEQVYSDADDTLPAWVVALTERFEDQQIGSRSRARQQLRSAAAPVSDTDENVMAITRDGEMGRSVLMCRDTPAGRELLDGLRLPAERENLSPQQREAIAMNLVGVPASWKNRLPPPDEEGVHWLPMRIESTGDGVDQWQGNGVRGVFRYGRQMGLRWEGCPPCRSKEG